MKRIVDFLDKPNRAKRALAILVLCAAAAITLPAQTFTSVFAFDRADGAAPGAALVQGTDGNFYGTTTYGGTGSANDCAFGCGTIFKITPTGTLTVLYNFCSQTNCTDGGLPSAGLVQAIDGNFYGTTPYGGTGSGSNCKVVGTCGTIFKITPSGTLTTLYNFCSQAECADGSDPITGLVQAPNGDLYGTTTSTVFKITPSGALTTLYTFCSAGGYCTDGVYPTALIQATDGDFYGTTAYGGANESCISSTEILGCGTVFKISHSGTLTTLYNFCSQPACADGSAPGLAWPSSGTSWGLLQATDGNFYGTTYSGGVQSGACYEECGTVFKITPAGALTTLYSFDSTDGGKPAAGLVQAAGGDFYGTTSEGGSDNFGTFFTITPSGTLTTLHIFCGTGCTQGSAVPAGLVHATDGTFYGVAEGSDLDDEAKRCSGNGPGGCGSVFSLSMGLRPFVKTQTAFGQVGGAVNILGTNLTGATSVTFNGTPAVFAVVSASEITATVPAGATSGKVAVVTPSGTLSSNVPFEVLP